LLSTLGLAFLSASKLAEDFKRFTKMLLSPLEAAAAAAKTALLPPDVGWPVAADAGSLPLRLFGGGDGLGEISGLGFFSKP